jgi:hypothetical protein
MNPETPAPQKVLYTSGDKGTPWWDTDTRENVEAYCRKNGITLVNLPKPKGYQPQWVIFDAFRASLELPAGSVAGWIDSDILCYPDAPDILSASLTDRLHFCQPDPPSRVHPNATKIYRRFNLTAPRPYIISALARWNPSKIKPMVDWFDKKRGEFPKSIGDQELLIVACHDTETYHTYFPANWHRMHKWAFRAVVGFLHAAGTNKQKMWKIKRFWMKIDADISGKRFGKIFVPKSMSRRRALVDGYQEAKARVLSQFHKP